VSIREGLLSEGLSSGRAAVQETQQLNLSLRAKSITYYITAHFSPLQSEREKEGRSLRRFVLV